MDNLWIASLADADRRRLEPHLHEKPFAQGQMLYDAGEEVGEVWFPLTGVVSLMTVLPEDRLIETAAIGREGLVGVTCGPMNGRASSRAIAQIEGAAACCPADVFSDALGKSVRLRVSTHGLRSVEHVGGLDNWLLKTSDDDLSLRARRLKREVRKAAAGTAEAA